MKKKIKNIIKNSEKIYRIYYFALSLILNFIKLFIKIDEKIILFNSFGGKKFDDSPKVIFDYMRNRSKYNEYKFYWAFEEPEKFSVSGATKIKIDTFRYFVVALRSKYWITNSAIERGLNFKNKNTVYINTWHGTPLKKMGIDSNPNNKRYPYSNINIFYAQGDYDIKVFSKAFNLAKEKFALVGLPRNDELKNINLGELGVVKNKLGIPQDKKVILYAPTFREYERDINGCFISPPIEIIKWREALSDRYVILFRAHYEINKILNILDDNFIINVSDYDNLNELMKISDILISDYSSIMFDYSILGRPIFSYAYDYDVYKAKRGLYIDISNELPNGIIRNEDELLDKIANIDYEMENIKTNKFNKKYVQKSGEATKYIEEII